MRRRRPKLEITVHLIAICLALVLSILVYPGAYYVEQFVCIEQPVQGLFLLTLSTMLLMVSRSNKDESETQIFS